MNRVWRLRVPRGFALALNHNHLPKSTQLNRRHAGRSLSDTSDAYSLCVLLADELFQYAAAFIAPS